MSNYWIEVATRLALLFAGFVVGRIYGEIVPFLRDYFRGNHP